MLFDEIIPDPQKGKAPIPLPKACPHTLQSHCLLYKAVSLIETAPIVFCLRLLLLLLILPDRLWRIKAIFSADNPERVISLPAGRGAALRGWRAALRGRGAPRWRTAGRPAAWGEAADAGRGPEPGLLLLLLPGGRFPCSRGCCGLIEPRRCLPVEC